MYNLFHFIEFCRKTNFKAIWLYGKRTYKYLPKNSKGCAIIIESCLCQIAHALPTAPISSRTLSKVRANLLILYLCRWFAPLLWSVLIRKAPWYHRRVKVAACARPSQVVFITHPWADLSNLLLLVKIKSIYDLYCVSENTFEILNITATTLISHFLWKLVFIKLFECQETE